MVTTDFKKLAIEYRCKNPTADFQTASRYAQELFPGEEGKKDVIAFMREWWGLAVAQKKLEDDCARCWPEEKGY